MTGTESGRWRGVDGDGGGGGGGNGVKSSVAETVNSDGISEIPAE